MGVVAEDFIKKFEIYLEILCEHKGIIEVRRLIKDVSVKEPFVARVSVENVGFFNGNYANLISLWEKWKKV